MNEAVGERDRDGGRAGGAMTGRSLVRSLVRPLAGPLSRAVDRWGWAGRSQVQHVRLYTLGSLYVILWFVLLSGAVSALAYPMARAEVLGLVLGTIVLGVTSTLAMRAVISLHPATSPVPWSRLVPLVAAALLAEGLVLLLPEKSQFAGALIVVMALSWGMGGLRDRAFQWGLFLAYPALVLVPTGHLGLAIGGAVVGLFFTFTVQSSLWLMGVVIELERARTNQAALAVAEERLRFSRDVHDVMGRQLSTIAVQAELAATLAGRGDARAADRILQVRETAHEALREARELARGYRPLDLSAELDGAVSLLKAAGIAATADLDGLPSAWHEPVARVVREAVTNVLRHSGATRVEMSYVGGAIVIRNDGLENPPGTEHPVGTERPGSTAGSGLAGLTEQLAPSGAVLRAGRDGEEFVVRVELPTGSRAGVVP